MRLVFSADEAEQYSAARDELLESVAEWARRSGREGDSFALMAALDGKYDRDGRLDRWRSADLRALLLEWFPRKAALSLPECGGVVPTLHALVDFLGQRRWLGSGSAPVAELHATIDENQRAFLDAMADERNYDIGKFWTTRMIEHGVDPEDQDAVRRFIDAVHSGEVTVDQSVLDEIMRRRESEADPVPSGPELPEPAPVRLPPEPELIEAARAADIVARLRTFAGWLGTGRTLTRTGRLTVAQGRELAESLGVDRSAPAKTRSSASLPQVSLTVAWAKKAGIARTVKGKLVPVKKAAPLLDKPLELWGRAFDAFGKLGVDLCDSGSASLLACSFDEVLPVLWWGLYSGGESPLPEELLHLAVRDTLVATFDLGEAEAVSDARQHLWRQDLARMLDALRDLGAVTRWDSADPADRAKIAEISGRDDPSITLVRPAPLGLWKINGMLRDQGFSAPVEGEATTA
ncbi:hypothetical protein [Halosaccharopolyspora lacisalsi]|nr:hypothetical protein [Halosaccharopolyspora lacisalsi]